MGRSNETVLESSVLENGVPDYRPSQRTLHSSWGYDGLPALLQRSFQYGMMIAPRFRTYKDAMTFMDCIQKKTLFPKELWVFPFKQLPNGDVVETQEYMNAPYEIGYLYKDGKPWRIYK
jgi:hypothetical protein